MDRREGIATRSGNILDEVQLGLFEIAGARDFLAEGGDHLHGTHRMEEALWRIRAHLHEVHQNYRRITGRPVFG